MFWSDVATARRHVKVTKLDFCIDLSGSFIPTDRKKTYNAMKGLLEIALEEISEDPDFNVVGLTDFDNFTVRRGDNILDTCYQFTVFAEGTHKVLTCKVYDKVLDLLGRDGCKTVGSRFATVLGSKYSPGRLEESLRDTRSLGLTRIEISIHLDSHDDMRLHDKVIR